MEFYKSVKLFISLIKNLYVNKKLLNDDLVNNYSIARRVCRDTIYKTGVSVNIKGLENIPISGPILVAPNHISFFDIILLISVIERELPFAAAKELTKYPILKDYINGLKCTLIDRSTNDVKVVKEQIKNMGDTIKNTGLIVFPEGECSYNQEVYDFKKGSFLRTKDARIIPTYISMPSINKIGRWVIPTSDVDIIFGNSFSINEVYGKSVNADLVAQYTRDKVLELRRIIDNR